ncbi:FtsX-like permease family protein [Clostridium sp.]|uniref:ABC transporter permease n=1 Tax=Clostridium sp. TaxID=1506 RepID=UPI0032174B62
MNIINSILKRKSITIFFILSYTFAILTFSVGNSAITSQEIKTQNYSVDNNKIIRFEGDSKFSVDELLKLLENDNISITLVMQYGNGSQQFINFETQIKTDGLFYKEDTKEGQFFEKTDFKTKEPITVVSSTVPTENNKLKVEYRDENNEVKYEELECKGMTYQRAFIATVTNEMFFNVAGSKELFNSGFQIIINGKEDDLLEAINKIETHVKGINKENELEIKGYSRGEKSYEAQVLYQASFFIILITIINSISISSLWVVDRKKEIILRKVMGAKSYDIVKMFFGELTIISLGAVVLAISIQGLGALISGGYVGNIDIRLHLNNFIFSFILAIVTAYLSALPAFKHLTKIQPAEVLREE